MKKWVTVCIISFILVISIYSLIYFNKNKSNCIDAGETSLDHNINCCRTLVALSPCEEDYGNCSCVNTGYVCTPCGNGKCEKEYNENKCNCVKDCK
jgi:hypothetical protein